MNRSRLGSLARSRSLRGLIGLAVSLVCIWLVVRGVDVGATVRLLGQARPAWLMVAVVAFSADLGVRALRWQRLVAPIHRVPYGRLTAYMLVGYLANNVLPARLGELVRSHYLGDREGVSRSATLGTVLVERIIDTVVLVAIGAGAILVLHVRGVVANAVLLGLALTVLLCLAVAVALVAHRLPGAERAAAYLRRWPRAMGVAARIRDGLSVAALPKTVGAAVVLSVVAWSCTVVGFVAVGQALGIELTWAEGALLAAGTNLSTAIPSGPGYVGTFEYAGQRIALAFGLAGSQGLALALLAHVATLVLSSLGGVVAFIALGWARTPLEEAEAATQPGAEDDAFEARGTRAEGNRGLSGAEMESAARPSPASGASAGRAATPRAR